MQDITSHKYEFTITPIQLRIKSNSQQVSSTLLNKSIIIKLGQSIAKCTQLNTSIKLISQVLYSSVNCKYCSVKGIIKIYDIVDQKNQIIAGVGTFQAQDILQNRQNKQIITKSIGNILLKMEMSVRKIPQRPSIQIKNDNKIQNVENVSSQNVIQNQQGRQQIISQQKMQQQLNKFGGLRRVNTMNLAALCKNDIIDLKGAINFGFSTARDNKINISGSHLQSNMTHFRKSINSQYSSPKNIKKTYQLANHKNKLSPVKNVTKTTRIQTLEQLKKQDFQADSDSLVDSNMLLQVQSNISKQLRQNEQRILPCPPHLLNIHNNPTISNTSNQQQQQKLFSQEMINTPQLINSLKIEEKISNNKQISKSINFSQSNQLNNISNNKSRFQKSEQITHFQIPSQQNQNQNNSNYNNPDLANSNASVATSMLSYPQILQEYQKSQIQTLGELLIEQRRKNLIYQQKNQKLQLKIVTFKQKYLDILHLWENWCEKGLHFLQNIHKDIQGNYLLQIYKQNGMVAFKYDANQQREQDFTNFLVCTLQNCSKYQNNSEDKKLNGNNLDLNSLNKSRISIDNSQISSPQINRALEKINFTYKKNTKLIKLNQQQQMHLHEVQDKLKKAQTTIASLKQQKQQFLEQKLQLQSQIQYLQGQVNSLVGINSYLKQKDWQMESIITLKQGTIQNMKKIMENNNQQFDKLQEQISNCKKSVQNKQLMLQQMRQQLADRQQIIENYKQSYGQIRKYYKSRQNLNSYVELRIQQLINQNQEIGESY